MKGPPFKYTNNTGGPMTAEQVEDAVSRGTTDHGRVKCLYHDDVFALVKWPGGRIWSGAFGSHNVSPWVERYENIRADGNCWSNRGRKVWECDRSKDGPLTKPRIAALIEREKQRNT